MASGQAMNYEQKTIEEIDRYFTSPFWRGYKWHIYASLEMLNGVSPIVQFKSKHWSDIEASQWQAKETGLDLADMYHLFMWCKYLEQHVYACRFSRKVYDSIGYLPVCRVEKILLSCGIGVANKNGLELIMQSGRETDDFLPTNEWWGYLLRFRDDLGLQIQRYAIDLEQLATKHTKPVDVLCAYQVKSTEHGPIIREIEKRAAQLKSSEVIADVPESTNTVPGWTRG